MSSYKQTLAKLTFNNQTRFILEDYDMPSANTNGTGGSLNSEFRSHKRSTLEGSIDVNGTIKIDAWRYDNRDMNSYVASINRRSELIDEINGVIVQLSSVATFKNKVECTVLKKDVNGDRHFIIRNYDMPSMSVNGPQVPFKNRYHKNSTVEGVISSDNKHVKVTMWDPGGASMPDYIAGINNTKELIEEIKLIVVNSLSQNEKPSIKTKDSTEDSDSMEEKKESGKKMGIKNFIGDVKSEISSGAWRVGATNLLTLIQDPLCDALAAETGFKNKFVKAKIVELMQTEAGKGVMAFVMGSAIPLVGMALPEDMQKMSGRMAQEMRQLGYEKLLTPLVGIVTGPLRETFTNALKTVMVTEKLRIVTEPAVEIAHVEAHKEQAAKRSRAK